MFVAYAHRLVLAAYSAHFERALAASTHDSPTVKLDIDPKITGILSSLSSSSSPYFA